MRRQVSHAPQPLPGAAGQSNALASPSAARSLPTPLGPSNRYDDATRSRCTAVRSVFTATGCARTSSSVVMRGALS